MSVFTRMLEDKAANQLPDYYLAIKRRHAQAIENSPELKVMFSMFGSESLSILRTTADFSVKRTKRHEVLTLHPYANDFHGAEQVLPLVTPPLAPSMGSAIKPLKVCWGCPANPWRSATSTTRLIRFLLLGWPGAMCLRYCSGGGHSMTLN
ncbi:hypothetical protein ACYZUD_26310 [Pseudomonas sp. XS1P51]